MENANLNIDLKKCFSNFSKELETIVLNHNLKVLRVMEPRYRKYFQLKGPIGIRNISKLIFYERYLIKVEYESDSVKKHMFLYERFMKSVIEKNP